MTRFFTSTISHFTNYHAQWTITIASITFFFATVTHGQTEAQISKVKASFLLQALPDNSWKLYLKKDKTYQYVYWSGFSDKPSVIDEGTYTVDSNEIKFKSTNEDKSFDGKTCYIKSYTLKRKWQINTIEQIYQYKKRTLFRQKIILFSYDPIDHDQIEIVCTNP